MDIQDLELVRAIHNTGSLSRACDILHVSQPTLSKRLSRLEHSLGVTLFHRQAKGLVATDIARYILAKAVPLRAQMTEIERQVELMTHLDQGQLRLGVDPIIEQVLLPGVLDKFVTSTGNVQLSIATEDEGTLLSLFAASELDIVVGPFRAELWADDHVIAIPMISDQIIAVARAGHPVFNNNMANLEALLTYHWVAPKAQGSVQGAGDHPITSRMKVLSDNYDMLKKLTLSADVICAGPRGVFADELENQSLREISTPLEVVWDSALLIKPETLATPLANHLVTIFTNAEAAK